MYHESMPGCVPEYYRARQEDDDHRYEIRMQRQAHFLANRAKLDAAAASGLPVLPFGGFDACWECPDADHDTMTGEDDDFDRVICCNPACQCHQGQAG